MQINAKFLFWIAVGLYVIPLIEKYVFLGREQQ